MRTMQPMLERTFNAIADGLAVVNANVLRDIINTTGRAIDLTSCARVHGMKSGQKDDLIVLIDKLMDAQAAASDLYKEVAGLKDETPTGSTIDVSG